MAILLALWALCERNVQFSKSFFRRRAALENANCFLFRSSFRSINCNVSHLQRIWSSNVVKVVYSKRLFIKAFYSHFRWDWRAHSLLWLRKWFRRKPNIDSNKTNHIAERKIRQLFLEVECVFSLGRAIICLDLLMEAFVGNFNAPYAIDTHFFCWFCFVLLAPSVIFDFKMVFFRLKAIRWSLTFRVCILNLVNSRLQWAQNEFTQMITNKRLGKNDKMRSKFAQVYLFISVDGEIVYTDFVLSLYSFSKIKTKLILKWN